ncbi:MAG TPA: hypothetical protein VME23_11675 [Terracidiphilus sp.]|nr:hypothetical protein [Terracidiphilus sp.]
MLKRSISFLGLLLVCLTPQTFADIAAIHADKLPQETAVLAALDDARQLEPFSATWTAKWQYEISKEEVATRLGKDLGFLKLAMKSHPDNVELLLLTGLVARYAYNVDVDGSYDEAMDALGQARKFTPGDFRAPWFQATLECQTMEPASGAVKFLSIEASHQWDELPAAFWDDYIQCASVTNMPAHILRSASYISKLHAPDSSMRTFLVGTARNRFDAYDPKKKYEPKEAWSGLNNGEETVFTSTLCGVRMHARGEWEVNQVGFNNGTCVAYFSTGPYRAITQKLRPSVLLMVQQPKENESLLDYAKKFLKDGVFIPDPQLHCPVSNCIALKGIQSGMYKADGDGHGRIVVFERDEPAFPGLIFESPSQPPKGGPSKGTQYYRPSQTQQRIPGKLYYLVLLDAAASIEGPALKDFDFFLENLTAE